MLTFIEITLRGFIICYLSIIEESILTVHLRNSKKKRKLKKKKTKAGTADISVTTFISAASHNAL